MSERWTARDIHDGLRVRHPERGVARIWETDTGYFNFMGVEDRFVYGAELEEQEVADKLNKWAFTRIEG